jgi:hypothetical protein
MKQVVKVAKIGKSINSTNPNDFIFHSDYNTFKIILEGTKSVTLLASTLNQTFIQAHGFEFFVPLIHAFAKDTSLSQVFAPNGVNVELFGSKLGFSGDIKFNYVASDKDNIIFNFDNNDTLDHIINIRYFVLERV